MIYDILELWRLKPEWDDPPGPSITTTREELGHSVAGCARTAGNDCARTNPSRVETVVPISAEKKLISC